MNRSHRFAAALFAAVLLAACGSGSDDAADTTAAPDPSSETTAAESTVVETTAPPTTEAEAPLRILVTNDDGVAAEGIDAVVTALETLPDVTVTIVAPLEQQSGTGGSVTEGPLTVTDATTLSGHEAKAVDGFPSDTIRAAFDDLGIEADLVVSGINSGQNLGPLIDVSGTVGAARAAVAKGIPALAVSQGTGESFDYESALPFVLDWVTEHRAAILDGTADIWVENMNVPSCSEGKVRGLMEVPVGDQTGAVLLQDQNCRANLLSPGDDVQAFNAGFVSLTENLRGPA